VQIVLSDSRFVDSLIHTHTTLSGARRSDIDCWFRVQKCSLPAPFVLRRDARGTQLLTTMIVLPGRLLCNWPLS
jgi:hypothetical protein